MPGSKEDDFYRNNALSLYDLYGHYLAHWTPAPGVMKVTILVDPSLVIITIYLVCLIYALGVEKKILKEIMHLYGHTLAQEPLLRGSWKLQFW